MKKILLILFTLISVWTINAQNYDDVVVIINENSAASTEIGEYFAQKRYIPDNNLVYISTTTDETIDSLTFVDLKNQIKSAMRAQGLDGDAINYLVTTKGMPFNLEIGDCESTQNLYLYDENKNFLDCSCIESNLAIMFHPDSNKMASSQSLPNPYFNETGPFSHALYETHLISRLDGYTVEAVKDLIDRSGPNLMNTLNQYPAFIFDVSYNDEPIITELIVEKLTPAMEYLESWGCNVILDTLQEMPSIYGPVMSYHTWNFDPFDKEFNAWLMPGAMTELVMHQHTSTFYDSLNVYNELIMSDMIDSEASAVSSHVHPFFLSGSTFWENFYLAFYPIAPGQTTYTLGESYFRSVARLSWMELLVGDPKTTIQSVVTGSSEYYLPKVLTWLSNTNTLTVKNASPFTSGSSWIIYNAQGQAVKKGVITTSQKQFNANVSGLDYGMYIIHIKDSENRGAVGKFILN